MDADGDNVHVLTTTASPWGWRLVADGREIAISSIQVQRASRHRPGVMRPDGPVTCGRSSRCPTPTTARDPPPTSPDGRTSILPATAGGGWSRRARRPICTALPTPPTTTRRGGLVADALGELPPAHEAGPFQIPHHPGPTARSPGRSARHDLQQVTPDWGALRPRF